MAARAARVVALDVSADMLLMARSKAEEAGLEERIEWLEIGVAELDGLTTDSFDIVCSSMCFSELTPDERRFALNQAWRLLRSGGLLLLADEVRPQNPLQRSAVGLVRFPLVILTWLLTQTTTRTVVELPRLVREAGFEVLEVRTELLGSWQELMAVKGGG
jgi:demethylmenaquinone methyltransferase/2-methoxy-6-polyprenyl-1,4-benzoquinol methylase